MTNIMVASDIHGSAKHCQKLIQAFNNENSDILLLLGDILGWQSEETARILNGEKSKILCVKGNCDLVSHQKMLEFPMDEYHLLYVKDKVIFATHGNRFNKSHKPSIASVNVLLQGHTHIPSWEENNGYLYLNPGSVSEPRWGSTNSYMIITDESFLWKDLDGKIYHELNFNF